MKKFQHPLFCLTIIALCLVPLLATLVFGPSDQVANEAPTAAPRLVRAGKVNPEFLSDAADWFDSRFALRPQLITANAALNATVFHESTTDSVILGKDGWLYYADTLADYQGTDPMTDRELFCAVRALALMEEWCENRNISFVFAAAPNKNSLYPEHMPARYLAREGQSDLDRFQQAAAAAGVPLCDLYAVLSAEQEVLYYKTDSHWNGKGSYLASGAILKALGRSASTENAVFDLATHSGDLYQMLYPAGTALEAGPRLTRTAVATAIDSGKVVAFDSAARHFLYVGNVRGPDDMTIRTESAGQTGTLFCFRDSFGNTLHADLAEQFAAATFSRAMPYDLTLVEEAGADTLVVELVERNLRWLAQRPAVFAAPARELDVSGAAAMGLVPVKRGESPVSSCVRYDGTWQDVTPDDNSPVYVCVDGAFYEATPTAQGFTLHAPAGENVQVFFYADGVLVNSHMK